MALNFFSLDHSHEQNVTMALKHEVQIGETILFVLSRILLHLPMYDNKQTNSHLLQQSLVYFPSHHIQNQPLFSQGALNLTIESGDVRKRPKII